ncbi:phosphotransferase family protein [Paenibacillus ginsengarvi]|uniref:Aminoglycoside phosphotransferase family protein n=1 Tax=Paenibacillus ginsengarvi TaxID=400777 RepID=A0A3B0CI12_9BACL|nr:aminoglycoside phosphotransferase family protein [Paenibacillus ginsengarvi]RKN85305.1 aminoglycoside phosphotransferase family protein [Paenibacillus ginsengarvi]
MGTMKAETLHAHLCDRHPELSGEPYRVLSSTMQNLVIVVGERLVFRFPLTSDHASLLLEMKLLPKLGKHLPLPVPDFLYTSGRKDKIVYVGYPMIPGIPLEKELLAKFDDSRKKAAARQIADFLTALHQFTGDSMTRVDPRGFRDEWRKTWSGYYRAMEQTVFPHLNRKQKLWIMQVFYDYLYPSGHFKFTPCLLHSDFKNDHIFHDPKTGKLTGVIDFGLLRMGDPAYDFHDLCLSYGETFTRMVLDHYGGPADRTFEQRITRFYAYILRFSSMLHAVQAKDWNKLALRMEWLNEKGREWDDEV